MLIKYLFLIFICLVVIAPDARSNDNVDQNNSAFSLDNTNLEEWLEEINIPTTGIGLIKNSQLQEIMMFGDTFSKLVAPKDTVFNVASLAKPVSAIIALTLASKDQWDLDEPLSEYWVDPDIENDPRALQITTRHVLSHQTGFPNWRHLSDSQDLEFLFDPGDGYHYSGEGYEYLRRALESKFDRSLAKLAQELVFGPLGMQNSSFLFEQISDDASYADNYAVDRSVYPKVINEQANAADDLFTTVEDYSKFLLGVSHGEKLSKEIYAQMITPQTQINPNKHFGLGFIIYQLSDNSIVLSHGGGDVGVQTLFMLIPETGDGLLIFTNVDDGYKIYQDLLVYFLGSKGEEIFEIEMNEG
ncbi:MAG: beta-lactamase family protein [Acidiferrobacterales bacterium]|nr:beta-lactamase family protein [Acidiferrobacterales bacterium]